MHDGFGRHPVPLRLRSRTGQIEPVGPLAVVAKHVMAGDRNKPKLPVHHIDCEQDFATPDQGAADHGEHRRRQRLQGALCALPRAEAKALPTSPAQASNAAVAPGNAVVSPVACANRTWTKASV